MDLVEEVKKKREFSGLPDSVVARALKQVAGLRSQVAGEFAVKDARKLLRKYFGVFLTNRVLRFTRSQVSGRRSQEVLGVHISSKKRDYQKFYEEIFSGVDDVGSIVDLGCGVSGFSYEFLREVVGDAQYLGVEAAGQLVDLMNLFFDEKGFDARAVCGDLFDVDAVLEILRTARRDRVVFLFQVVDALESVERNFSLRLIGEIMKNCEKLVISVPLVSLGGGKKFAVKRKWLIDFLEREFVIERDFEMFGERILVVSVRKT